MVLNLQDSYTECGDKSMGWVLRRKDYFTGKVDLASQGLIEIFTEGEVDPRFPQEDMLRGICSRLHII